MNIEEIKQIIELMQEHNLAEFEMEKEGFRILMRKSQTGISAQSLPVVMNTPPAVTVPEIRQEKPKQEEDKGEMICSPMVGTFYSSPSPDSDVFVNVGDEVHENDVVCILEAMKVMNEIKAEVHGRIVQILVENAEPVEYGQPLFKIERL